MAVALTMDAAGEPLDDDSALLGRWRERGDREAIGRLFARHADDCWRLAHRLCGNAADADDALQQALIKAMRRARSHRGGSVRGWLLAITANNARDQARRARSRVRHERATVSAPPPAPDEETAANVRAALARLPESYSVPVVLAYVEGMTSDAIAAILGVSAAAVRKRCERALARLRADPGLAGAAVPALLAALPSTAAPETCRAMASSIAAHGKIGALSPALVAGIAIAVIGAGVALAPRFRAPAPVPPPASVADDRPAPAPRAVDADAALLDQRVTLWLHQSSLDEALTELELALPPGRALARWPFTYVDLPVLSRDYADAPVRRVLDDLAAPGWTWHAAHGCLTFYQISALGAAGAPSADGRTLRELLLRWATTGDESALEPVFGGASNFYNQFAPIAALDDDREVREAVRARIERLIAAGKTLPARGIEIAGALHLAELAPAFLSLLASSQAVTPDSDKPANPDDRKPIDDVERRLCLIMALGEIGGERAVPALTAIALDDGAFHFASAYFLSDGISPRPVDSSVFLGLWFCHHRDAAIHALARLRGEAAVAALRRVAADPAPYAPRWLAEQELARIGDTASLPALREALRRKRGAASGEHWDNHDPEPTELCAAIGRLGDPGEVLALLDDPTLRQAVLPALFRLRDPRIAPTLLALLRRDRELAEATAKDGDTMVFAPAVQAVAAQRGAAQLVLAQLAEPGEQDATWRRVALFTLAATRTPEAVPYLGERAVDAKLTVAQRADAVHALGWSDRSEAVAPLAHALEDDPDPAARRAAVDAMAVAGVRLRSAVSLDGAVAGPWAHLARAMAHDPDATVRAEAAGESRRSGDPGWIDVWIDALLAERDPGVAAKLVEALEQTRFHGLPKHDCHRSLVALALAPEAAQPAARKAVEGWLQAPNEDRVEPQELVVALQAALAARTSAGAAGVEEAARVLDARLQPRPAPASF